MAFCKYCGQQYPDGGTCSCPQAQADAQQAAQQVPQQPQQPPQFQQVPQQQQYQQPPQQFGYQQPPQQFGYQQPPQQFQQFQQFQQGMGATASAAAKSIMPYFKSFLADPMQAIRGVVDSNNLTLALTLTIVRLLSFGLAVFGVFRVFIDEYCDGQSDRIKEFSVSFFGCLLYGALAALIGMALFIVASFIISKLRGSNVSIQGAFEASAANGVLVSALLLLAFVAAFISNKLCMILLLLAFISWIVCGVQTTQIITPNNNSGVFWAGYIVCVALVIYVGVKIMPDLLLKIGFERGDTEDWLKDRLGDGRTLFYTMIELFQQVFS